MTGWVNKSLRKKWGLAPSLRRRLSHFLPRNQPCSRTDPVILSKRSKSIPYEHSRVKADPNLVPLLDLVFQLIMFFMICVNFVSEQVNSDIHCTFGISGFQTVAGDRSYPIASFRGPTRLS